MYSGRIIRCGEPREILENPENEVVKKIIAQYVCY